MHISNELFFEQIEAEIAEGREVEILVKGHSMRPWIRSERDRVVLVPVGTAQLAVGDIVLFRYRGRHILHRIVRREGDRFTLAGDGNCGTTEHCTQADVVAVVTAVVRRSGRIVTMGSCGWRTRSQFWLNLPVFVRRVCLGVLWQLGCR